VTNSGEPIVQTRGGSFDEAISNGYKLLEQHPSVALQQAETLLRSSPDARAFELAAAALTRLGKHAEAEQAELSAIRASFAIRELDDAAVAGHEGRRADSQARIEQFLRERPRNLLALTMAAELDIDDWRLERAEERLRTVLERAPTFLRAIMLLSKCLQSQARLREGVEVIEGVVRRKPNNSVALFNLALTQAEANRHADAAETYRSLLDLKPEELDMWVLYAQELRMLGRKVEATKAFRRALELDPHCGGAWWGLANYFPSEISDDDVATMETALSARPEESGALHIALGVIAERRGDNAESFRHISEGKRLRARAHPYDAAAESAKIDERIQTFTSERFAAFASAGCPDDSPIFIIGMPRSGTTLLERILSRHSQIEAGGELPILPRLEERLRHEDGTKPTAEIAAELTRIGERYIQSSRDYRTSHKPRFIDKLNYNWSRVGLIRMILPNAKIIDLRRNALDCCWANFKLMFAEGHIASNDQRDIARFYRDYVRLVEAVDEASPAGILKVRYEALVDDVEGQTRRILQFLGLEYEPECIDFHLSTAAVATPSSEQVRRPINRDSIGSALPYRQWLGPMIEELGELADQ
jgi:tetratricopeptide (TPR) repeat protein